MAEGPTGTPPPHAERRTARSIAREAALMVLFGFDGVAIPASSDASTARSIGIEELLSHLFREVVSEAQLDVDTEARGYAEEIARGVASDFPTVDKAIKHASQNWRIERMSRVDRNVLRIGAWELMHDVPRAVVIDEAVELAKRYGSEDSGAFVNGVLDKVASDLKK